MRALLLALLLLAPGAHAGDFETGATPHYEFEWAAGLEGFARALMARAEVHHERIYAELGVPGERPTTVILLHDESAMLAVAHGRLGGRPPEWAQGLAYPSKRTILLHAGVGPQELDVTFQHEISHIALGEIREGARIPRWFSEGLAIKQSEGLGLERAWLLTEAATVGVLHDLRRLERGFPSSGARAGVAYAQAVHFVGYLQKQYGAEAFAELLRLMREEGVDLADAAEPAFGASIAVIEQEWRRSLKIYWGWLPVVFGSTGVWGFASVLLLLAWRRRRRQKMLRLEHMALSEALAVEEDIRVASPVLRSPPPRPEVDAYDPYDGRPPTIH